MKSSIKITPQALATIILCSLLHTTIQAQERWSVRYDSGFNNTFFLSVLVAEDGYFASGFLGEEDINGRPMILTKFDLSGNLIYQNITGEGEGLLFSSQNPDLNFLNDSVLIHSGISFDQEEVAYIAKTNLQGDTLNILSFSSPFDVENNLFRAVYCIPSLDGNIFLLASTMQEGTGLHLNKNSA